jgi:hypothetical protein
LATPGPKNPGGRRAAPELSPLTKVPSATILRRGGEGTLLTPFNYSLLSWAILYTKGIGVGLDPGLKGRKGIFLAIFSWNLCEA